MSGHWTDAPAYEVHDKLVPYLESLKTEYRDARMQWLEMFVGMYSDLQDISLLPSRAGAPSSPLLNKYAVPINVVAPLVDTAEARITQARPRPFFKTVGGSWSQQRQAKKLQKFADGIFDETHTYRLGAQALKDAALLGTGCVKTFSRYGKICAERVLISEILVDESLGFDRNPPELGQVKEVSRTLLGKMFEKVKGAKEAISRLIPVATRQSSLWTDMVEVYECWWLARGEEKGRHVIVIQGCTLLDEPWEHDYFPITFIRWREAPTGFHGLGIAQQIMSPQIDITSMVRNINKNLHLFTNPRVITYNGSAVNPAHITNAWGTVLQCNPGMEPKLLTPPYIVPPEVYQWFQIMYSKCFELVGLSSQSAFAKKEPGLNSGKAIREMADIQSDRMAPVSQRYESFYLDLTRGYVDTAEKLYEEDPSFAVVSGSKGRHAERLKWKDVKMPKDDYTLQLFAANFLSRTPSGLFEDIQDLMSSKLIDPATARKLLDFPDLQQVFDNENASRDNFENQIEKILDESLMLPPQPFDDLALGIKTYRDAYNRARLDDVPEAQLELMREWITQAQALVAQATPQPAPAQPALQAPPIQAQPAQGAPVV